MSTESEGPGVPYPNAVLAHAAACALIAGVAILYSVHSAMPHNAVELPFEKDVQMGLILPEGWAFFTKSPKDPRFLVFGPTSDGSWARRYGETTDLATTFAFSRKTRSLGVEAGLIASSVTETDWRKCSSAPSTCMSLWSGSPVAAINETPRPTLCGPLALVKQDRLPWAWANTVTQDTMSSRIVRIDVRCTRA
jgi:antimicrobial peptide system SdpA family protein